MKYVKKRIPVDAWRFSLENFADTSSCPDWVKEAIRKHIRFEGSISIPGDEISDFMVHTIEGPMRFNSGDWIIKGIKGELYPCRNDIFRESYELWPENETRPSEETKAGPGVSL
jgi:hypothetical protein